MRKIIVLCLSVFLSFAIYSTIWFLPSKPAYHTNWLSTLPQHVPLTHLVLGDSLAKGYGSKHLGYVGFATKELNRQYGLSFQLVNLAKNGMTSEELLQHMKRPSVQKALTEANLITISIGGNDLLQLRKKMGLLQAIQTFSHVEKQYQDNLQKILANIREENPTCVIVLTELYNPIPFHGKLHTFLTTFIENWNKDTQTIGRTFSPVILLPISDLLLVKEREKWAYDKIHPNDIGYQILAKEMVKSLSVLPLYKE